MRARALLQAFGFTVLAALWGGTAWTRGEPECVFVCPEHGPEFRRTLALAIGRADRILVTEHSSPWDSPALQNEQGAARMEFEYRRIELDENQRRQFREIMEALDPRTQDWASACIPEFHHTVRFYEKGGLASTLRICFGCQQVEWDGIRAAIAPPGALYKGLRKFVAGIGMQPDRDWGALAAERLAANRQAGKKDAGPYGARPGASPERDQGHSDTQNL